VTATRSGYSPRDQPPRLRQWCRECQAATVSTLCAACDGIICASCLATRGIELCARCAAELAADDAEG
jgi:hypothetical protein